MTIHRVDPKLRRDLNRYGAFDIDACFNCGNCTAVCQHSNATASFPRRLIRYGQLGMRERLVTAKEAWLCWNCRECADSCPRQARPSEYLEAVRRYTIAGLDPTGISHLMYSSPLFLVGFSLFLAALFSGVLLSGSEVPATATFDMFGFLPFELIHDLGVAVLVLMGLVAAITTVRLSLHLARSIDPLDYGSEQTGQPMGLLRRLFLAARAVLEEMAFQRRFRSCDTETGKPVYLRSWFVHYSMMWGFIGLGMATAIDFIFKTPGVVVPLWYPARLLGTVAGAFLVYGVIVTIARRLDRSDPTRTRLLPSDWLFLGLLLVVSLTGFVLEVLVYQPQGSVFGYGVFLVHVVLAMELLVLLPFTKFAHAIYRPLAYGIYRFRTTRPVGGEVVEASVAQ